MALPLYGQDPLADFVMDGMRQQQRMAIVRRAANLPSSAQVDLASSALSDNELDEVAQEFGASPATGYGFSDILHGLMSRQPEKVPTTDIKGLQSMLRNQALLPPEYQPSGVYDAQTHGAFRRYEYLAKQAQSSGNKFGSAPVSQAEKALELFAPSALGQQIVGQVKGYAQQAPETLENLGAAGGALTGAAIGALAGSAVPIVGTAVGAIGGAVIGGVAGFMADLFGDDNTQVDTSEGTWWDPLLPNEYLGENSRQIWEDVAWVATTASLAGGAATAGGKIAATVAGARAAGVAGGLAAEGAGAGLAGGVAEAGAAAGVEGTGTALTTMQGLLKAPATVQPGMMGKLASGLGGKINPAAGSFLNNFFRTNQVIRAFNTPVMDIVKAGYTGTFTAAFGGMVSQGIAGPQKTTIEKAVEDTPRMQTGIQLPLVGDLVDLPGFFINPTQWLPIPGKLGGLAKGLSSALGDRDLAWIAEAVRAPGQAVTDAMSAAKVGLGYNAHLFGGDVASAMKANWSRLRMASGARLLAEEQLVKEGFTYAGTPDFFAMRARKMKGIAAKVKAGDQGVYSDIMDTVRAHEGAASADLLQKVGARGPDAFVNYNEASDIASEYTRRYADELEEGEVIGIQPLDGVERSDVLGTYAEEFYAKRMNLQAAVDTGAEGTIAPLRAEFNRLVDEVESRDLITKEMADAAKADRVPTDAIGKHLDERAGTAPETLGEDFDPQLVADLQKRGYQPIRTYDDSAGFSLPEIQEMGDGVLEDIGTYSRRQRFFDNLGVSWRSVSVEDASKWRYQIENNEIAEVLKKHEPAMAANGITMAVRDVRADLREVMKTVNNSKPYKYMRRYHPRDLNPIEIRDAFERIHGVGSLPAGFEHDLVAGFKRGAAFGADVMRLKDPMTVMHDLGAAMRVNGLPGFSDFIRTMRQMDPDKPLWTTAGIKRMATKAIPGAAAGGALTLTQPDADAGDFLRAAAFGGVGSMGLHAISKVGAYGYLPDKLVRLATALRYTLSPTFDIGRYMEANSTMGIKYGLGPVWKPTRTIDQIVKGGIEDFSGRMVYGDEAKGFMNDLMNQVDGGISDWHMMDDLDRRLYSQGVLHYRPREFEQAYVMKAYKNGMRDVDELREMAAHVNGYGLQRTALEKSINFVVFPFSFQKKVLNTMGDFMVGGPGRGLLIHEGMRRYHQSSVDEKLAELVNNHLPALSAVADLNSFAFPFGVGPGEFFLSGMSDRRSLIGKVMQAVTAITVPSGAHMSLANVGGIFGDQINNVMAARNDVHGGDPSWHAFVPTIITGEDLNRVGHGGAMAALQNYVPLLRDMNYYFGSMDDLPGGGVIGDTIYSLSTNFNTPYHELDKYQQGIRNYDQDLEPLALSMGFQTVDGFLASDDPIAQIFKEQRTTFVQELGDSNPAGRDLSQTFEGHAKTDDAAIRDLIRKGGDRTPAEDQIVRIQNVGETAMTQLTDMGVPTDDARALVQSQVRQMAYKFAGDMRFQELWDRFFAYSYGPIVRTA